MTSSAMNSDQHARIARSLITLYRHLGTFEVDPLDERACEGLSAALENEGCTVSRVGTGTCLRVIYPSVE